MEIQKRIVFAVELEFTLTSPFSFASRRLAPRKRAARLYFLARRRFICPSLVDSVRSFRPVRSWLLSRGQPTTIRCHPEPKVIGLPTRPLTDPASRFFLGDRNPLARLRARAVSRGDGKASRPNQRARAGQDWPATAFPTVDAFLVQQAFQLVRFLMSRGM